MKGKLLVISGPSGVGKDTLVAQLFKRIPNMVESVSATTRKPRTGDQEGVNYFFRDKVFFQDMIKNGELLEWNEYAGNFYGTPKKFVEKHLEDGNIVLLSVDVHGAIRAKKNFPQAHLIFIEPPSIEELRRRLQGRGTETSEEIEERLSIVESELNQRKHYDFCVVNDDLNTAVDEIVEYVNKL